MRSALRVLLVEDSENEAQRLVRELVRGGFSVDSLRVDTAESMRQAAVSERWDLILSDNDSPFGALSALGIYKNAGLDAPLIVISGAIGEEAAVEVLKAGAHDFVRRDRLARLVPAVRREIREAAVRSEVRREHDARRSLEREREQLLDQLRQENQDLAALAHMTDDAISTLELDELLVVLTERLAAVMHADLVALLLADGDRARLRASKGLDAPSWEDPGAELTTGLMEAIGAAPAQLLELGDCAASCLVQGTPAASAGVRSLVGVALRRGSQLVGVGLVGWHQKRELRRREAHLLRVTAWRCTTAILNAHLYEQTKRMEQEMRVSEQSYRTLFHHAADGIFISDLDGKFLEVNQVACEQLGYDRNQLVGMGWADVVSPELADRVPARLAELAHRGAGVFEATLHRRNGSPVPVEFNARVVQLGARRTLLAMVRDVTERRTAEQALRESDDRYSTLFDSSPLPMLQIDVESSRILRANEAAVVTYGHSKEVFQTLTLDEICVAEIPDPSPTGKSTAPAYRRTQMHVKADGSVILVQAYEFQMTMAGRHVTLSVFDDVTERWNANDALRQSEQRYREVFEKTHDGILLIDVDGDAGFRFAGCNPASELMLGVSSEDLAGKPVQDVLGKATADAFGSRFRLCITQKRPIEYGDVLDLPAGRRHLHVTLVPVQHAADVTRIVGICHDVTEVERAEEERTRYREHLEQQVQERTTELARSEGRTRAILDAVGDGIVTVDDQGIILGVNPAALHIFEYQREDDLVGRNVSVLMPSPLRELHPAHFQHFTAAQPMPAVRSRNAPGRRSSGAVFPADLSVSECVVGGARLFIGSVRDMTESRAAEAALRESEERHRVLFEASPDGILIASASSGKIVQANPAACAMLGMEANHVLELTLADIPGVEIPPYEELFQHGPFAFVEIPCRSGDRPGLYVDMTVAPLLIQGAPHLLCVLRDVTERRNVNERLRILTMAMEQSPVSVVITDREGAIEYVNPKFTTVTGYTYEEAIGSKPRILKSGFHDSEFYRGLWDVLLAGREWHGQFCNRRKNQQPFWESASISGVKNASGKITHFVAVKEDITERKRVDEELQMAKEAAEAASRAKSVFLANVSHEIRTPMNAILGFSQLLLRSTDIAPEHRKQVETIKRAGEHLLKLINDVLEMSKIEAGRTTLRQAVFDLLALLDDIHAMIKVRTDEKGLEFVLERDGGLPRHVVGDEGKLRQVLINLLGNAVKFTSVGAVKLRVRVARDEAHQLFLLAEVEDSGAGIAETDIEILFRQFEQTETGRRAGSGTGLGLAISREFVRLMGGDMGVTSRLGKGSIFWFHARLLDRGDEVVKMKSQPPVMLPKLADRAVHVLIADDQQDNRDFLRELLVSIGMTVWEAPDGVEAIDQFQTRSPDLVLMDLRMPRMNGVEAIRRIRALPGGDAVKVIGLSASAFHEHRVAMLEAGADAFVGKPFLENDLLRPISELLGTLGPQATEAAREEASAVSLPGAALADPIPPMLREALCGAALAADLDRVLELIQQLPPGHRHLAREMRACAERFDYPRIMEIISPGGNS